jgi:hypothetical protein
MSLEIKMCLNETYSKVRIGKLLSDKFPIQNDDEPSGSVRKRDIFWRTE